MTGSLKQFQKTKKNVFFSCSNPKTGVYIGLKGEEKNGKGRKEWKRKNKNEGGEGQLGNGKEK